MGPLRTRDAALLDRYDAFFRRRRIHLVDVSAAVMERATELRALHRFRTPDAIHLATAIEARADVFLTGDVHISGCPGLCVEVFGEPRGSVAP